MPILQQMLIISGEEASHKVLKSFPKKWLSSTLLELRLQPRPTPIVKVSIENDFRGVRFIKRTLLQCVTKKIHQLLGIKWLSSRTVHLEVGL